MAFADTLKEVASDVFDFTSDQLYTAEGKAAIDKDWGLSPRVVLQKLGTAGFRRVFGPDVWAASLLRRIPSHVRIVLITDVRFENEAEMIRAAGGLLIRVIRPNDDSFPAPDGPEHESETALDYYNFTNLEMLHNDGGLADLHECVQDTHLSRILAWIADKQPDCETLPSAS